MKPLPCTIRWVNISPDAWRGLFSGIRKSNLVQSYPYAQAICALNHMRARWGVITFAGKDIGLFQILETRILWGGLHTVTLDRGPLWFDGCGTAAHVQGFLSAFSAQFPRRFGRKRRIMPEIPDSQVIQAMITQSGFLKTAENPYQTIWLDLTKPDETLRSDMRKNWRGALQKAERLALEIEWDTTGRLLPWILGVYLQDKTERAYRGASLKTMQALARFFMPEGKLLVGRMIYEGRAVAGCLFLCHGASATYQIGWTDETGRRTGAQNRLLWNSVQVLRKHGIKDMDMGGVNDETASGVRDFKSGMGGTHVTLCGTYT